MQRNNFGLQCDSAKKAKDISCTFPRQGSEILPARERHGEAQLLIHIWNPWAQVQQPAGSFLSTQGPASHHQTAHHCCSSITASPHAVRTSHCTTDTTTTNSSRCQHLYLPHTKIIYRQSLVRQIHPEMQSDSHRIKRSPEPSIKTDKPFSLRLKFMPAPQNVVWIDLLLSATCFC